MSPSLAFPKSGLTRWESFAGGESFAGVKLGFRFSTELQTAARKDQPKQGHLNRGGTSAPLDDELGRLALSGHTQN